MKYIYSALVLALAVLVFMLINLFASLKGDNNPLVPQHAPKYHFVFITRDTSDPFWSGFKQGATQAGTNENTFIEFVDITHKDPALITDAVERAILSGVDGIALQPLDVEKSSEALNKARQAGIAVLTYENDVFNLPDYHIVGSNNYEIGYAAGKMAFEATGGKAKIAVIANDPGVQDSKQYNNIKVQGLIEAIAPYPQMSVEEIYTLNTQLFEVEKLTTMILTEKPEINLIICSDSENTPGVAQVVIDSGKVGNVGIIGYGVMPQTVKYIRGGVMYGTITPDSFAIGYNAVEQLAAICDGKQTSEYVNTNIYTFTAENLDDYKEILNNK